MLHPIQPLQTQQELQAQSKGSAHNAHLAIPAPLQRGLDGNCEWKGGMLVG